MYRAFTFVITNDAGVGSDLENHILEAQKPFIYVEDIKVTMIKEDVLLILVKGKY